MILLNALRRVTTVAAQHRVIVVKALHRTTIVTGEGPNA